MRPRFVQGEFDCIRVSPSVFSTLEEIDLFAAGNRRRGPERSIGMSSGGRRLPPGVPEGGDRRAPGSRRLRERAPGESTAHPKPRLPSGSGPPSGVALWGQDLGLGETYRGNGSQTEVEFYVQKVRGPRGFSRVFAPGARRPNWWKPAPRWGSRSTPTRASLRTAASGCTPRGRPTSWCPASEPGRDGRS